MPNKQKTASIMILTTGLLLLAGVAQAADKIPTPRLYPLNTPLGKIYNIILNDDSYPPLYQYISTWYSFLTGTAGIIATVMIMYGGLKWLNSRGNPTIVADAKEKITSAIIGLILLFLSWTILNFISPNLLDIKGTKLTEINAIEQLKTEEPQEQDETLSTLMPSAEVRQASLDNLIFVNDQIFVRPGARVDNLKPEIMEAVSAIQQRAETPVAITSGYRNNDSTSQHYLGNAVDLRREENLNRTMYSIIGDNKPIFYYHDQPAYRVTYQGINLRIIDERANNCWHIDIKPND